MFAQTNTGTNSQSKELQKLKRQDLLELLLEQMRENDDLNLELERRNTTIAEQDGLVGRLKAKLDLKDQQIEHLKEKLDLKDAQIEHLKKRLDSKDDRIAKFKGRLDLKDQMIAGLMSQGRNLDMDQVTVEDLLKTEEFALEALMANQQKSQSTDWAMDGASQDAIAEPVDARQAHAEPAIEVGPEEAEKFIIEAVAQEGQADTTNAQNEVSVADNRFDQMEEQARSAASLDESSAPAIAEASEEIAASADSLYDEDALSETTDADKQAEPQAKGIKTLSQAKHFDDETQTASDEAQLSNDEDQDPDETANLSAVRARLAEALEELQRAKEEEAARKAEAKTEALVGHEPTQAGSMPPNVTDGSEEARQASGYTVEHAEPQAVEPSSTQSIKGSDAQVKATPSFAVKAVHSAAEASKALFRRRGGR